MTECDELIDDLQRQASVQVGLAMLATATPVAEMHLDIAFLHGQQIQEAERLCDE